MPTVRVLFGYAGILLAGPAWATALDFNTGDVICVGYEKETHSCSSIGIVRSVEDGLYTTVERAKFDAGQSIITLTIQTHSRKNEDRYCMTEQGVETAIAPADAPLAPVLEKSIGDAYAGLTAAGLCVEHEPCGSDYVAQYYISGVLDGEMATAFTLFRADDARIGDLALRTLTMVEALSMGDAQGACAPET